MKIYTEINGGEPVLLRYELNGKLNCIEPIMF